MSWSVDGIEWSIPCTIERTAEVEASDISGMMLNKTYFNDVLGTWMKYTVAIAVPMEQVGEYSAIYEVLTDPKNFHEFVLPYNDGTITLTARVQTVSDVWVRLKGNKNYWRKTKFDIIANAPTKEATADGLINHGLAPYPVDPDPEDGVIYQYSDGAWVNRDWSDADEIYY